MYLDAWASGFDEPAAADEVDRTGAPVSGLRPGHSNAAMWLLVGNRLKEVLEFSSAAVTRQNRCRLSTWIPRAGRSWHGAIPQATQAFDQAIANGFRQQREAAAAWRRRAAISPLRSDTSDSCEGRSAHVPGAHQHRDRSGRWKRPGAGTNGSRVAEKKRLDERVLFPVAGGDWMAGEEASALRARGTGPGSIGSAGKGAMSTPKTMRGGHYVRPAYAAVGGRGIGTTVLDFLAASELRPSRRRGIATSCARAATQDWPPATGGRCWRAGSSGHEHYQAQVALKEAYADGVNWRRRWNSRDGCSNAAAWPTSNWNAAIACRH